MSLILQKKILSQFISCYLIQWATKMKEKTDVNYYSGDKIDDLIKNTDDTIAYEEGVHLTRDKNYSDDMYSEELLKVT